MRAQLQRLVSLALAASIVAAPAEPSLRPDPSAAAAAPTAEDDLDLVQYHHDVAIPEDIDGMWTLVRGAPGTGYELYIFEEDGQRTLIGKGVLPDSGQVVAAWASNDPDGPPAFTRGEIWTRSDAPVGALVEIWD